VSLSPPPPRSFHILAICLLGLCAAVADAQSSSTLVLGPDDLRIEQLADGGYHLYVRAKKGIGSILLTESTKDPGEKTDSFAYRALEKNKVNGDEKRVLGGKVLVSKTPLYFLVDSNPEPDRAFGRAFHIFIPSVVAWGYPWSRSGQTFIHDGSFVNIRTFEKSYADYSGAYADNPYLIRVSQARETAMRAEPDVGLYIPETLASFQSIADANRGQLFYASSDRDIASRIDGILERHRGKSLDLVLCVDATDSMTGALGELRVALPPLLSRRLADFPSYRLGIVAYKDYFEEYLYKHFDFTRDQKTFVSDLDSIHGGGGRDIPEAVYEGLDAALTEFPWQADCRLVVLVGDAPPHPLPRGSVSSSDVNEAAASQGIEIDSIAVPK
jgi:hypothetical protein